jgi:hypothetical protein
MTDGQAVFLANTIKDCLFYAKDNRPVFSTEFRHFQKRPGSIYKQNIMKEK